MNTANRIVGFVKDSQNSPFVGLLILVGAIGGVKDFLGLLLPGEFAVYFLTAVVVTLGIKWLVHQRRIVALPAIPSEPKLFKPFIHGPQEIGTYWPRKEETTRLVEQIRTSERKHFIVTGRSGAGKSTLLSEFVTPLLCNDHVLVIDDYDGLIEKIVSGIKLPPDADQDRSMGHRIHLADVQRLVRTHIGMVRCSWREAFDPTLRNPIAEEIAVAVAALISARAATSTVILVFDQFERISSAMRNESSQAVSTPNAFEVLVFRKLANLLRSAGGVRTVFIVRSDALYHTIEFLNSTGMKREEDRQLVHALDETVAIYVCPGINIVTSSDAVTAVEDMFREVDTSKLLSYEFQAFTGMRSSQLSNTFLIQLTGFMIEHFGVSDKRIPLMLKKSANRITVLRYYFDYLMNDFRRSGRSEDDLDLFKAILFSIAIENRVSGRSITGERISLLSHVPIEHVISTLDFLSRQGIVIQQAGKFRMIHDMVSDYVIEEEHFAVNSRMRDAIEGLVAGDTTNTRLTPNPYFPNLVGDLFRRVSFGQISILIFFAFGLLQIASTSASQSICSAIYIDKVWGSIACKDPIPYYWAIFLMHGSWLTYIYTLQRGYLLRNNFRGWLQYLVISLPIVGAWLAILFSRSPILSLVPITVVGISLSLILFFGAHLGVYFGRAAKENARWGIRTFFNMIFSGSLMLITAAIFFDAESNGSFWSFIASGLAPVDQKLYSFSPNSVKAGWIMFVSSAMIYFWLHIKPEQQSDISLAARLALFDRARLEQAAVSDGSAGQLEAGNA